MSLRQALAKHAFGATRVSLAPPSSVMTDHQTIVPPNAAQVNFRREYLTSMDTPRKGFFLQFLHLQSASKLPEFLIVPDGEKLREKLRGINISGNQLRLGDLSPPPPDRDPTTELPYGISVRSAKKILRLSQVEKLKAKLREIPETSISRSEFVRICSEGCESESEASIISQSMPIPNDPRSKELHQMETQKMLIDQKARALVRGELYCGLGFLLFQTIGAMRLTFWELNWDVMEPICFFVTSIHFALGYAFFLRTSTEPTFQGFFHRRFTAKQRRLMEAHKFDVQKYNQLRKVFYPNSDHSASFHHKEGMVMGSP
ncbi:hypothetical protein D8674_015573 [Pyrus ussuriensis x Pyrus communis]|uniref:Calcium uniporter protein C-terminal domain-containing protein n=1 Tax=Pyrus ussuriensis x Pyrus communis TaxID=2448454 RepID=A0A5N5H967_9ROSA|nr:hypothetical protein D8674_015573 [Pyrus ussuriensis x Pyrus communis]